MKGEHFSGQFGIVVEREKGKTGKLTKETESLAKKIILSFTGAFIRMRREVEQLGLQFKR